MRLAIVLFLASVAGAQTFDFATAKAAPYSAETGYGLEPGGSVTAAGGCLTTTEPPFYFSVKTPEEGNYRVTVKLGDPKAASVTTVKAELRRLMLERVRTEPGRFETRSFLVNVRTPKFPGGEVRLKDREKNSEAWAWDDRLTLEFTDAHPSVCSIAIEKARQRPYPIYRGRFHLHRPACRAIQQLGPDADALLQAGYRRGQSRRIGRIAARASSASAAWPS